MLKLCPFSNSASQSLRRAARVALLATACLSFSALGQGMEAPVADDGWRSSRWCFYALLESLGHTPGDQESP